jgi:hypothetical protein
MTISENSFMDRYMAGIDCILTFQEEFLSDTKHAAIALARDLNTLDVLQNIGLMTEPEALSGTIEALNLYSDSFLNYLGYEPRTAFTFDDRMGTITAYISEYAANETETMQQMEDWITSLDRSKVDMTRDWNEITYQLLSDFLLQYLELGVLVKE